MPRGMVLPHNAWVKNKPAIPNNSLALIDRVTRNRGNGVTIPAGSIVNPVIIVYGYLTSINKSKAPYPPDEAIGVLSNIKTAVDWYTELYCNFNDEIYHCYDNISNSSISAAFHFGYRVFVALPNRIQLSAALPNRIELSDDMFDGRQFIAVDKEGFSIKMPSTVIGFIF